MKLDDTVRCCASMILAHEGGTDNEGYGTLVYRPNRGPYEGRLSIGDGLPPIVFCPWCGTPLSGVDHD